MFWLRSGSADRSERRRQTGTVTAVNGDTLSVTTTTGKKVTVDITATPDVTRTGRGGAGSLDKGDSVTVAGKTIAGGAVVATSVTATAKGITVASGGGTPTGLGAAAG